MRIVATITYRCHTCGELIVKPDGSPDMEGVVFVNGEGEVVEPPFPPDTTTHHAHHQED